MEVLTANRLVKENANGADKIDVFCIRTHGWATEEGDHSYTKPRVFAILSVETLTITNTGFTLSTMKNNYFPIKQEKSRFRLDNSNIRFIDVAIIAGITTVIVCSLFAIYFELENQEKNAREIQLKEVSKRLELLHEIQGRLINNP